MSLSDDLQNQVTDLESFKNLTVRVLNYYPEIITSTFDYHNYLIHSSVIAGTTKFTRPINKYLFISDEKEFSEKYQTFIETLSEIKSRNFQFETRVYKNIDMVLYTIQQVVGVGLDLLVEPNSARKHIGNRFEELIKLIINSVGLSGKKIVLSIPYKTDEGEKNYRCETDFIISPYKNVKSTNKNIHPNELVISTKTTTKDRMSKIFIDKILIQNFVGNKIKVVGISVNDIQRKEDRKNNAQKISHTFLSNLFMVYKEFLVDIEGYYYFDIPEKANKAPYNQHIFNFSKFIVEDIWKLIGLFP